jgi:hypothetical protein
MSGFDAHRTKHAFMRVNRVRCTCAHTRDLPSVLALHLHSHTARRSKLQMRRICSLSICTVRTMLKGGFSGGSIISDFRFEGFRSNDGFCPVARLGDQTALFAACEA